MAFFDLTQGFPDTIDALEAEGVDPRSSTVLPTAVLERLGIALPPSMRPSLDDPEAARRLTPGWATGRPRPTAELLSLGRLQLGPELGRGGMGRVLEAWDRELKRRVAVKIVLDPSKVGDIQLARFVAEAQITSQLQHPNIVPVYDMGATEDGQVFFVMKKVTGVSLHDLLQGLLVGDPTLTSEWNRHKLLMAFVQVCNAVAYAHSRGVLHRDLKPANIMAGEYGEVLVMDWGLARQVGADPDPTDESVQRPIVSTEGSHFFPADLFSEGTATRDGTTVGTPGYMGPEQLRGDLTLLDDRSDLWSLGAILFEVLTYQPAYDQEDMADVIRATLAGPPPDPRERAPELRLPDEIAEVCTRAMAIEPDDRQESVAAFADEIESFLEGARRREQALALVEKGRTLLSRAAKKRQEAGWLHERAAELLADVQPHDPEDKKAPGWEKETQAATLEDEAELDEVRFMQTARAALERAPDLPEGHDLLAGHYREQHAKAEAAGDARAAARFDLLLQDHDLGSHADYLKGEGRLTLVTDPPGAVVEVFRYAEHWRRLVPRPDRTLDRTPLSEVAMPMGSYLLELKALGRTTVRYPVRIDRLGHWDGVRPGGTEPHRLYLPRPDELGADDVYVPAGWYPSGGDPAAAGGFPARRIWVDAFVMRRFPVTHGEWLEFLNALVVEGREDEALRFAPREAAAKEGELGDLLLARDPEGRFHLDEARGFAAEHPVASVEWEAAAAYAAWMAERTDLPWRLPCELEWEKAARGADGRPLPWGAFHDPSWCVTVESHAGPPAPAAVEDYPIDESPYGARGLAGGVRDWCVDVFSPEGPEVTEAGLLVIPEAGPPDAAHVTRGGAWSLPDWVSRAAVRGYHTPVRLGDLGLRLVRPWSGTA